MSPARIIVADDSEIFRSALCDFLGHVPEVDVVAVAQDGEEALRLVQEADPDILLLDIHMPKLDGWEVLRRLQSTHSRVRVLVLSSYSTDAFEQAALEQGASAYVAKGKVQQLLDAILRLMIVFFMYIP